MKNIYDMDIDQLLKDEELEFDPLANKLDKGVDSENQDIDYSALAQSFDTSWGRSSTPKTAQFSVKFQLDGANRMIASYCAIVNFASERDMIEQKRRYASESTDILKAHVKFIKDRYKGLCGKTLSVDEMFTSDSVECISMNFYNPRKVAYFRKKTAYQIG